MAGVSSLDVSVIPSFSHCYDQCSINCFMQQKALLVQSMEKITPSIYQSTKSNIFSGLCLRCSPEEVSHVLGGVTWPIGGGIIDCEYCIYQIINQKASTHRLLFFHLPIKKIGFASHLWQLPPWSGVIYENPYTICYILYTYKYENPYTIYYIIHH